MMPEAHGHAFGPPALWTIQLVSGDSRLGDPAYGRCAGGPQGRPRPRGTMRPLRLVLQRVAATVAGVPRAPSHAGAREAPRRPRMRREVGSRRPRRGAPRAGSKGATVFRV